MKNKYCPTQAGEFTAYRPEYKIKGEWRNIQTDYSQSSTPGVPYPLACGGMMQTIGLFGLAQANALRWQYKAVMEAMGKEVETNLVEYEVTYDIKAKKIEEKL